MRTRGFPIKCVLQVERKHLAEDPDWVDSDEEDEEPDEGLFEKQVSLNVNP